MEFKVVGDLKTEGEKTNGKGEVVDVDFTIFSLVEQKPKGSVGVPIQIKIKCEGSHVADLMTGDIFELKKKAGQTKLGQNPLPLISDKEIAAAKKPEQKSLKADKPKRSHHAKKA